jgi:3-oxoacyl-[acyl-carrier protein] reductase
VKLVLRFSQEHVLKFAEITGDFNPAHVDPQFARKTRYRRPVVHGMLPVLGLSAISVLFPDHKVSIQTVSIRFLKPVFCDDVVELDLAADGGKFSALITKKGIPVTEIKGTYSLLPRTTQVGKELAGEGCLFSGRLELNAYSAAELENKEEELPFTVSERVLSNLHGLLRGSAASPGRGQPPLDQFVIEPELAFIVVNSPLVGMRLPGKFVTFVGLQMAFSRPIGALDGTYRLTARTDKVFKSSSRATIQVVMSDRAGGEIANAKIETIVMSVPEAKMDYETMKRDWLPMGLSQRVVLVTGASRGIGEATAKLFGMMGAKVAVHFFQGSDDALAIVDEIRRAGGEAIAVQADVRLFPSVQNMVREIESKLGPVDVLVNNAVHDPTPGPIDELTRDGFLEELDVTLFGAHHCCRAVIPGMKEKRAGKIINIGTVMTDLPVSGQTRYVASKSALVGYTRSLAVELAALGIQVNMVVPQMTDTSLLSSIPAGMMERMRSERPTGAILHPAQIAQSVVFLASNWANAISGSKVFLTQGEGPFV